MGILLPAPIHEDEETSMGVSAPTSSTTVALSLGDALAIATAHRLHTSPGRGPAEIFKSFHPGGAIGAASTASTPVSMSSVSFTSFTSTPSDFLPVRPQIPTFTEHQEESPRPLSISSLVTATLDQIPTVSSATQKIKLLDVLLTAIQHPNAKSWVFVSPSVIIPPRQLRSLSRGYVDMDTSLNDLDSTDLIPRDHWHLISDECTVEEARRLIPPDAGRPVIAVVRGQSRNDILGMLEVQDLWDDND